MIDYLSNNHWLIWILISLACLILELGSGDLFLMCFAIGALGGSLTAALGGSVILQIIVMAICSLLSVYFIRPVALKYLHKSDENRVSNADALMGREGRVVETIVAGGYGRVQIDGDIWKAVSNAPHNIAEGTPVRVIDRASTIITVETV